jgi:hypothetical protein
MRRFFRSILAALSIACLAASFGTLSFHPALAQAGGPPPQLKQIALTQTQIDNVLASAKEIDAITQLDGVAKKHGFASYDDYNTVVGNISLVMDGTDPQAKKYIGSDAVLKQQLEQTKADKTMSAADKKQALANINMALKTKEPEIQNKGNIDLVIKNYDKLDAALGEQPH